MRSKNLVYPPVAMVVLVANHLLPFEVEYLLFVVEPQKITSPDIHTSYQTSYRRHIQYPANLD